MCVFAQYEEGRMDLKTRIERLLSDILSDKYEAKITLHFEPKQK
jgi:hypothetical protein